MPLPVGKVTVDVESAGGSLKRIDYTVIVAIELLEMIVQDIPGPGVRPPPAPLVMDGIVALGGLELSHVGKIWLGLDDCLRREFL